MHVIQLERFLLKMVAKQWYDYDRSSFAFIRRAQESNITFTQQGLLDLGNKIRKRTLFFLGVVVEPLRSWGRGVQAIYESLKVKGGAWTLVVRPLIKCASSLLVDKM